MLAWLDECPHPDRALAHLERWLKAAGNPSTLFDHLAEMPALAQLLVLLFGASHQLADVLVQNPELAALVLDPEALLRRPDPVSLAQEADRLLSRSTSYLHSLDRLRFLRQAWSLRIAVADLGDLWPQAEVWQALSDLADAVLRALVPVVWLQYCEQKVWSGPCRVSVLAMGKLGGHELNYSSDIDLVYVLDDEASESEERHASRFAEALGRALTDKMGRGALYRVDLRLRPFGGTGPIVSRMRAVEAYYAKYAEVWEHLALIRSRPVVAPPAIATRWAELRERTVFQGPRGEWSLEGVLEMRTRTETLKDPNDLKRGPGGIRDVEMLAQILQMLHGREEPALRVGPTIAALMALSEAHLAPNDAETLARAYTFLRRLEHRCQLIAGEQTHALPSDPAELEAMARSMGFADAAELRATLSETRAVVRHLYQRTLQPVSMAPLAPPKGLRQPQRVTDWFGALPETDAYLRALYENADSAARVDLLADRAPLLLDYLRADPATTEQVISGEIVELHTPDLKAPRTDLALAQAVRRGWLRALAGWALGARDDVGDALSTLAARLVERVVADEQASFGVAALGSLASRDLTPLSDLDLVFIGVGTKDEPTAARVLARLQHLRTMGSPFAADLRLRPEGRQGPLVIGERALSRYATSRMEPWERLALCRRSSLTQPHALARLVALTRSPLDRPALDSLIHIKRRIEQERVRPRHLDRDLKLGHGSLDDIEWTLGLTYLSNPELMIPDPPRAGARLRELGAAGALNVLEVDQLLAAHGFLYRLRVWLALNQMDGDVVPENPDKLATLAKCMGLNDANALLAEHERHRLAVRGLFEQTVSRLLDR